MIKSCGGCKHFIKWNDGGLCDIQDRRTKSDHGGNCPLWKGIKYKRIKMKILSETNGQE